MSGIHEFLEGTSNFYIVFPFKIVRSIPDEEYLATVDDECTGCVTCLACTESDKDGVTFCRWCTGGSDLKVWDQLPLGKAKKRTR